MHGDGKEFLIRFEQICEEAGGEVVEGRPTDRSGGTQTGCKFDPGEGTAYVYPRTGNSQEFDPDQIGNPGAHIEAGAMLGGIEVESFSTSDSQMGLSLHNDNTDLYFQQKY